MTTRWSRWGQRLRDFYKSWREWWLTNPPNALVWHTEPDDNRVRPIERHPPDRFVIHESPNDDSSPNAR
jgi:hypothetical protein